jgi:uncharacterized iron-regulated membrane protein
MRVAVANGLHGPLTIGVPADLRTAWTVTEQDGRDSVAVDATTGTITDRIDFAGWPLMAKLTQWGIYAHMGNLFGLANQILLAALALGLICVIVWGYRMWWQRRPVRTDRAAPVGRPPARGAWRELRRPVVAVCLVGVVAVSWALPALGVTLAAFLLVDVILGVVARQRARRGPSPRPRPDLDPTS